MFNGAGIILQTAHGDVQDGVKDMSMRWLMCLFKNRL